MKFLFDSSSIINLCAREKIEELLEGVTLSLAFYEIGNAVWKQVHLHKALTQEEGGRALDAIVELLKKMGEIRIEDASAVLSIAVGEGLTYYDASYLHAAIREDATLVTDDETLNHVAGKYVQTMTSGELS